MKGVQKMAQLAQNYEDFTGKVIDGIMNGLNNTEYGKEFTKKLAVQQLRENPDMTVEEWKDVQARVITGLFCMCVKDIPELNEEFKVHAFAEVQKIHSSDNAE